MAKSIPVRGIDHIGVTVPDIESAARFLEAAFGATTVYDVQKPSDPPMAGETSNASSGCLAGPGSSTCG
jgi:catechol 2,3-dioxygenase-like lactoylglutathione lyase family enzyme